MCDVRAFNYVRTLSVVYFVACLFSFVSFLFLFPFATFHGEIKISISGVVARVAPKCIPQVRSGASDTA